MKKNNLATWPTLPSENSLTTYSSTYTRRKKPGIIKLLTLPAPPTEEQIAAMNELATKHPFCHYYKVKKHDTL